MSRKRADLTNVNNTGIADAEPTRPDREAGRQLQMSYAISANSLTGNNFWSTVASFGTHAQTLGSWSLLTKQSILMDGCPKYIQ
jgi:hypothetical protein